MSLFILIPVFVPQSFMEGIFVQVFIHLLLCDTHYTKYWRNSYEYYFLCGSSGKRGLWCPPKMINSYFIWRLLNEIIAVDSRQGLLSEIGCYTAPIEKIKLTPWISPMDTGIQPPLVGCRTNCWLLSFRVTKGNVNLRTILRKYIYIHVSIYMYMYIYLG